MTHLPKTLDHQPKHSNASSLEGKLRTSSESAKTSIVRHPSVGEMLHSSEKYGYVLKIILLGDQGVGKTSFLKALKGHSGVRKVKCNCRTSSSDDHLEVEMVTCHGKTACVRLYDTGGQERYRSLTSSYYRGAHGVLLMFDLTNQKSMENIESWISDVDTFASVTSCVRVLLGSKCRTKNRQISSNTARKYAESRSLSYMKIDTVQSYNIVESLNLIVNIIALEVSMSQLDCTVIKPCFGSKEDIAYPQRKQFSCFCA